MLSFFIKKKTIKSKCQKLWHGSKIPTFHQYSHLKCEDVCSISDRQRVYICVVSSEVTQKSWAFLKYGQVHFSIRLRVFLSYFQEWQGGKSAGPICWLLLGRPSPYVCTHSRHYHNHHHHHWLWLFCKSMLIHNHHLNHKRHNVYGIQIFADDLLVLMTFCPKRKVAQT